MERADIEVEIPKSFTGGKAEELERKARSTLLQRDRYAKKFHVVILK
jgi:hypothetical protein